MLLRIAVIVFLFFASTSFLRAQTPESRVALVIGNSSYKNNSLKNPANDARDFAASLRSYGFSVIERINLNSRQVGPTLREFRQKLKPGSIAVVFYAGHGVQIKAENYLPLVDADISGEDDVPMQSLSTRQLMDVLTDAKTKMNLVFLDACRDNPYGRSFRSASRGLSRESAPSGTLISFATRPGSVAADGDGRNGLYTSVLLQHIRQSDQPIEQILKRVVSGVKSASKGAQEPWMEGSIEGDFCFDQCVTVASMGNRDAEDEAWQTARAMHNVNSYAAYLKEFPQGKYASAARIANEALTAPAQPPTYAPSVVTTAPQSVGSASVVSPPSSDVREMTPGSVPLELLRKYACTACHAMDRKLVGPSFADIAKKYPGMTDYLGSKIISGGSGVWGPIPMPPMMQIAGREKDARILSNWLSSGAQKAP